MVRTLLGRPARLGVGLAMGLLLALAMTPARAQLASTAASSAQGTSTSTSTSVGGGTGGAATLNQNSYGSSNETIHNTPDLQPPGLFGGTNPCSVGLSAGMSIAGLGLGGGGTWSDRGCERRNAAVILFQAGMPDVAVALLCQDGQIREAFKEAGKPCPLDRGTAVAAVAPATRPTSLNTAPSPASQQVATTALQAARVAAAASQARRRQRIAQQQGFIPPSWCGQPITSESDRASFNYYCRPPAVTGLATATQAGETTAEAAAVR